MTFWEHFLRLLPHKPIAALAALYWHATQRRVRARNRLHAASADLPFAYDVWVDRIERVPESEPQLRSVIAAWNNKPAFTLVLVPSADADPAKVARTQRSLESQIYPCWKFADGVGCSYARDADYIVPIHVGDRLATSALFRFAEALQAEPDTAILYGDHDYIDANGRRRRPWFKPEWNQEMFLAQDYISPAVAIDRRLFQQVDEDFGTTTDLPALMIQAVAKADGSILHVPHIVLHVDDTRIELTAGSRVAAVQQHVATLGASCSEGPFGTVKISWPLPADLPLVSLIVPTKDKLELLRACLESVFERTTYPNYEILVVDNASTDVRALAYLAHLEVRPRVRVLRYAEGYNFSAINNHAAARARGTFLCMLNNDTEIIEPDWLTELMRYAVRPDVGAVGAKLLYEDGSIQHAGVVVGIGEAAGHAHRFLPADEPGYFRQAHVSHAVSAVTAACLVVEKRKYEAVGGLDEEWLKIAFNDVDLCLKLQAAGWRNIYVPHAVLVHHESKSRGSDMSSKNIERYMRELRVLQERWHTKTYNDPVHNPNLDRYNETFVFRI